MAQDEKEAIAGLFRATAEAHHEAFVETDGDDPEWPLWYADHVRESLNAALDRDYTTSELVHLLVSAEKARSAGGAEHWPMYYAEFFGELDE